MNVGKTDYSVHVTVTDNNGCISRDTIDINVIEIPGAPVFVPDTQYFCDNNVSIIGKSQLSPTIGTFSWLGGLDPETEKVTGDANCLGIDEGAKVSVELELWCDGENILDGQHDLSRYCNITLQTFYEELHWVGTPMLQENYSFVYEYPGAIPIFSGTYNISNIAYDYFYFRFLTNTRSRIVVTWNQIFRDVQLIVHIRERIHGTDNSLYWNSHVAESEYYQIGGHQSHPARVLASDTLSTDPIIERNDTIKDCEPVTVGIHFNTSAIQHS